MTDADTLPPSADVPAPLEVTASTDTASLPDVPTPVCPGGCDDGNPCTADECASGVCEYVNLSGPCTPTSVCVLAAACIDGACVPTDVSWVRAGPPPLSPSASATVHSIDRAGAGYLVVAAVASGSPSSVCGLVQWLDGSGGVSAAQTLCDCQPVGGVALNATLGWVLCQDHKVLRVQPGLAPVPIGDLSPATAGTNWVAWHRLRKTSLGVFAVGQASHKYPKDPNKDATLQGAVAMLSDTGGLAWFQMHVDFGLPPVPTGIGQMPVYVELFAVAELDGALLVAGKCGVSLECACIGKLAASSGAGAGFLLEPASKSTCQEPGWHSSVADLAVDSTTGTVLAAGRALSKEGLIPAAWLLDSSGKVLASTKLPFLGQFLSAAVVPQGFVATGRKGPIELSQTDLLLAQFNPAGILVGHWSGGGQKHSHLSAALGLGQGVVVGGQLDGRPLLLRMKEPLVPACSSSATCQGTKCQVGVAADGGDCLAATLTGTACGSGQTCTAGMCKGP